MAIKMRLFKLPAYLLGILTLSLVLTANSLAGEFYTVKIVEVNPRSASGDVFIKFDPAAGETRFTERARGLLVHTDPGSNKIMAVILTAITLNSNVTILMDSAPTFNPVQVIQSAGLVAP